MKKEEYKKVASCLSMGGSRIVLSDGENVIKVELEPRHNWSEDSQEWLGFASIYDGRGNVSSDEAEEIVASYLKEKSSVKYTVVDHWFYRA